MLGADIWNYRYLEENEANEPRERETFDLTGFGVEALDGSIGKVDSATHATDASAIVVDTGPWIFGKKVLLPAGVVDRIDADEEKIFVHRTKDEIKGAPEFDESLVEDTSYRQGVGAYYGPEGAGYRSPDEHSHQW